MLNGLQQKLLDMLKWFDAYCAENEICYYVSGGTFLGAVRHQGFIPWDDDIDVMLPRPDYEKLLSLFKEKQDGYVLETPFSGNGDYLYTYSKLYDTTTTLIEHTRYNCKRGIYIDVFPLDGVGNSMEESLKNLSKVDRVNMFLMTRTCAIRKDRSFYKNAAICAARLIPKFLVDDKKLSIKVDRLSAGCKYGDSKFVANLMGAYREKEIFEKSFLGAPTRYAFEDISVNGPEDYDAYLTHIYGDWRKLPPKEKRVSHHDFVHLDLNHSYLAQSAETEVIK